MIVQEEDVRQSKQPNANGAFQVQTSGEEVALANVTSTMFAQRLTSSILSDDTTQEQHAHMNVVAQNQQKNEEMMMMNVTDHKRNIN